MNDFTFRLEAAAEQRERERGVVFSGLETTRRDLRTNSIGTFGTDESTPLICAAIQSDFSNGLIATLIRAIIAAADKFLDPFLSIVYTDTHGIEGVIEAGFSSCKSRLASWNNRARIIHISKNTLALRSGFVINYCLEQNDKNSPAVIVIALACHEARFRWMDSKEQKAIT